MDILQPESSAVSRHGTVPVGLPPLKPDPPRAPLFRRRLTHQHLVDEFWRFFGA